MATEEDERVLLIQRLYTIGLNLFQKSPSSADDTINTNSLFAMFEMMYVGAISDPSIIAQTLMSSLVEGDDPNSILVANLMFMAYIMGIGATVELELK